jgi:hypothetical protein
MRRIIDWLMDRYFLWQIRRKLRQTFKRSYQSWGREEAIEASKREVEAMLADIIRRREAFRRRP